MTGQQEQLKQGQLDFEGQQSERHVGTSSCSPMLNEAYNMDPGSANGILFINITPQCSAWSWQFSLSSR